MKQEKLNKKEEKKKNVLRFNVKMKVVIRKEGKVMLEKRNDRMTVEENKVK